MNTRLPQGNTKSLVVIAVQLIAIIGIIVFVLIPFSNSLLQQMTAYATVQEQNQLLHTALAKQQDAERAASETLTEMELDKAVRLETEALQFIEDIETIAATTAVEQTISFLHTARTKKANLVTIPITIRVSGSWENVNAYLVELEQSPTYVNVDRISVSHETVGEVETTIVYIQANTFWNEPN